MKKIMFFITSVSLCLNMMAQADWANSVSGKNIFPIVSSYEENTLFEFIAAEASDGNSYFGEHPHYYKASNIWFFKGAWSLEMISSDFFGGGYFLSFNYISKMKGLGINWNSGSTTHQFAFHPAKHYDAPQTLYGFLWQYDNNSSLYLVDLLNHEIVATLATNFKATDHVSINVFANLYNDESESLVITNPETFLIYESLPSDISGIRSMKADSQKKEVFDLNGRKNKNLGRGVKIIKDEKGESTKVVVK